MVYSRCQKCNLTMGIYLEKDGYIYFCPLCHGIKK